MCWEMELKSPHYVTPTENDWPEEELNLANHQLLSMLNNSVHVYPNI